MLPRSTDRFFHDSSDMICDQVHIDRLDVAAWSYQVVLDFWADGDPEVQHWVEEARAGLERLGVEPRR